MPDQDPTAGNASHLSEEEFEDLVAAALKVDPAGLSGKHRKEAVPETQDDA